jgi:hypothetical protein
LLKDYLKATKFLSIAKNNSELFEKEIEKLREKNDNNEHIINSKLQQRDDAISALSDQVMILLQEINKMKQSMN